MTTRKRSHKTRWVVRAADRIAAACITVGGVGTILAVSAVFLFLVSVVVPLFGSGKSKPHGPLATRLAAVRHLGVDEYRVCAWALSADGRLRAFRLDTGDTLVTQSLAPPDSFAISSYDVESGTLSVGLADGSIRLFHVDFKTDFLPADASPMHTGDIAVVNGAVVERMPEGSLRRQRLQLDAVGVIPPAASSPLLAIDHVAAESGFVVATLVGADSLVVERVDRKENEFTGEVSLAIERGVAVAPGGGAGARVLVAEGGRAVYVVDVRGHTTVFDTRSITEPRVMTMGSFAEGTEVRSLAALIGRSTVIVGDAGGQIQTWFTCATGDAGSAPTEDGNERALVRPRVFDGNGAAVTAIAASPRERLFITGYADGHVRVFQATSGKRVIDVSVGDDAPIDAVAFAPKTDGFVVASGGMLRHFDLDAGHPEATLRSLFRPVWYEGYAAASQVWQSSAGTDDFEPKLGLWPLVFGTLKATFYAMLFGVPLALLAAIYTSEFVSPSVRPRLKTLIESMASLPSVVLGFLAALVFAPFVQNKVPSVMVGFVIVPTVLLTGAYLWQMLPPAASRRFSRLRFPLALATLPVSLLIAAGLGPWTERHLFAGDMMAWLDGQRGSGFGGWVILLIAPCAAAVILLMGRFTGEAIRRVAAKAPRGRVAGLDLTRFATGAVATLALSIAIAAVLGALHLDPRGGLMGTYVQRNALVVGFVMGFAIIPIIYTIAEDALSAVPSHLRAASLGAGATPWQTATRIVLPTAMSGLFSAIMIGLGRAVGETMIVLMAAGNTPVLEMNAFNGFRTLSANIAVELPEAVRDSTHYRTLFLAALLLFAMTFAVNTVAEIVRLRFRKRSAQI